MTALQSGAGGVGGYLVEPWTALDSVAWQKVQGWQLGGNFETEVFRMLADARLGDPALTDALFPAYRADMPVITPSAAAAAAAGAVGQLRDGERGRGRRPPHHRRRGRRVAGRRID